MSRVGGWPHRALASGVVTVLLASVGALACGPKERTALAASRPLVVERVSTVETPTTTTTSPPAPPRRVLMMGDSVIWDTVAGVTEGFRAAGIEVVSQAFPGTSLLGGTDVTQTFRQVIEENRPDVVIAGYTGVYLPPYPTDAGGRPIELGSEAYWQEWHEAAARATADFSSLGARVYWVLYPHDEITWAAQEMRMNGLYRSLGSLFPDVHFIDWRAVVSGPFGAPVTTAPIGPGGAMAPVRGPDGHHFSADGTRTLGTTLVATVLHDYGLG